jgi:hypothetical protein
MNYSLRFLLEETLCLGAGFLSVCLETHCLGHWQKTWVLSPRLSLYVRGDINLVKSIYNQAILKVGKTCAIKTINIL